MLKSVFKMLKTVLKNKLTDQKATIYFSLQKTLKPYKMLYCVLIFEFFLNKLLLNTDIFQQIFISVIELFQNKENCITLIEIC